MTTQCLRSVAIRATAVAIATALISLSPARGQGPRPGGGGPIGTVDNTPSCPEYLLGQIDGYYYYATSDCKGNTGYGQSPALIAVPQCSNGNCGQKVSTPPGALDAPDDIPNEEIETWKSFISDHKTQLDKEIAIRSTSDSRYSKLVQLRNLATKSLEQLNSPVLSAQDKFRVNAQFNDKLGAFQKETERVGFAGASQRMFTIEDRPKQQLVSSPDGAPVSLQNTATSVPLKSASAITLDESAADSHNANVDPTRKCQVQIEKKSVVKVQVARGKLAYFQTFVMNVTKAGERTPTALYMGVQVEATPNAVYASFSERGRYAHRIKTTSGTPFLVNSIEDLGAN